MLKKAKYNDDVFGHLAVLRYVVILARSLSGDPKSLEQINHLMDAVHNTPEHLVYPDMYGEKYTKNIL